jgi:uncharacterized repeat protein (TIGR02543 family)
MAHIDFLTITRKQAGSLNTASDFNALVDKVNELVEAYNNADSTSMDIATAVIVGVQQTYYYTGEPIVPEIRVYVGGQALAYGVDYDMQVEDNNEIGTGKITIYGIGKYVNSKIVTFAIEGMKYNLAYDANDYDITVPATHKVSVLTAEDIPSKTLARHQFLGWFTSATGGVQATVGTVLSEDTTLYARFQQNLFNLSFVSEHGTAPSTVSVGAIPDLTASTYILTSDGYAFGGWYTDQACTQAAVIGAPIDADTTLYAKWVSLESTLTLVGKYITASCHAGATVQLYKDGVALSELTDEITAMATYSAVARAYNTNSAPETITISYDEDTDKIQLTSTLGGVTILEGATLTDGYIENVSSLNTTITVTDGTNTSTIIIENNGN